MISQSEAEFSQSQLIRMRYIRSAKEAGARFYQIREMFNSVPQRTPVETDMGIFTSFSDFLKKQGLNRGTIDNYITLYENWEIVLKLDMQDAENPANVAKSMRLCRTLKIIDWYHKRKEAGYPDEMLTIEQYWIEEGQKAAAKRQENLERMSTISLLKAKLALVETELETLRAENESLKQRLQTLAPA